MMVGVTKIRRFFFWRLVDLVAEEPADDGEVPEDGDLVLDFADVFSDEPAQDDGLAVPDIDAGGDLADAEVRQRQDRFHGSGDAQAGGGLKDGGKGTRVVIADELHDARDEGHLDAEAVSRDSSR